MTEPGPTRTLLLLRHGEAASPPGRPDRERPLTASGRAQVARAGTWIRAHVAPPDRILCSSALRTRQTAAATGLAAPVTALDDLYGADVAELLAVARDLDPDDRTVLVVGHAPALPRLAVDLAGSGSDGAALARLDAGFPPATLAVLALDGAWWGLDRGRATLLDVVGSG